MPEIKKVNEQIFDAVGDSVKKLAEVFPAAVRDGQVDFNILRQELGQFEEAGPERYGLSWSNKSKAKNLVYINPIARTLKYLPEDSKNPDTTQNLYIEGDNLEVLQLLRQNYYGKIKMIYIDPPYNTGNDFIYRDKFTMDKAESDQAEGDIDEEGNRLVKNQKSSNRFHANWLNMIYPRLKVAKDLLTKDGVIFVSIDDNEVHNLREVCDEMFGEENFIVQIMWKKRSTPPNDKIIGAAHDYIICYAKNINNAVLNLRERTDGQLSRYKNPDNHPKGPWTAGDLGANIKGGRYVKSLYFSIKNPNTGEEHYPSQNGNWRFSKDTIEQLLANNEIHFGEDGRGRPKLKRFLSEVKEGITYTSIWDFVPLNSQGSEEMTDLLGNIAMFDNPKPMGLIKELCKLGSNEHDFILDFFSGSGTTAHAVMQLNAEDGGNRNFIMVQYPEETRESDEAYKAGYKNICEVGKKRILLAGKKIKAELTEKKKNKKGNPALEEENIIDPEKLDIGFKVFRTADTNIQWTKLAAGQIVRSVEDMRMTDKDRLDFTPQFTDLDVVYEVMLRQNNIPLSSSVRLLDNIGKRTYLFADAYLVCLEESLTSQMIEKMAAVDPVPVKYILRDSAFDDNISLKDETIRRLQTYVAREHKDSRITYTVEFI